MRILLLIITFTLAINTAKSQDTTSKAKNNQEQLLDTIAPAGYVNKGKIAGRKAAYRSLIFPGLGQAYNYGLVVDDVKSGRVEGKKIGQKIYIVGKIAAIYVGGAVLVKSFVDNNNNYNLFLRELQYRKLNNDQPDPNNGLEQYTNTQALVVGKNVYKRNREVVLLSLVGLYGLNVLDAYVTARLKYFNVDETLSMKISPTLINSDTQMYGYKSFAPALKISFKL